MEIILTVVVLWLVCGVIGYGLTLAYFQSEYPCLRDSSDVSISVFVGVMGPCGLLGFLMFWVGKPCFHGLQFLPKPPTER